MNSFETLNKEFISNTHWKDFKMKSGFCLFFWINFLFFLTHGRQFWIPRMNTFRIHEGFNLNSYKEEFQMNLSLGFFLNNFSWSFCIHEGRNLLWIPKGYLWNPRKNTFRVHKWVHFEFPWKGFQINSGFGIFWINYPILFEFLEGILFEFPTFAVWYFTHNLIISVMLWTVQCIVCRRPVMVIAQWMYIQVLFSIVRLKIAANRRKKDTRKDYVSGVKCSQEELKGLIYHQVILTYCSPRSVL